MKEQLAAAAQDVAERAKPPVPCFSYPASAPALPPQTGVGLAASHEASSSSAHPRVHRIPAPRSHAVELAGS